MLCRARRWNMLSRTHRLLLAILSAVSGWTGLQASQIVENPYWGVTLITRSETVPRNEHIHVVEVDLTAPGIGFKLTPPGGTNEVVRQTTLAYLNQEGAQLAVNAHFFLPFPSSNLNAFAIGLGASNGNVF